MLFFLERMGRVIRGNDLNQPIEVEALRPRLRDAAHDSDIGEPQLLFRMGYGPAVAAAVRAERWRFSYGRKLTPARVARFAFARLSRRGAGY